MSAVEELKRLIEIPSYLDEKTNEINLGNYLIERLNTISGNELNLKKQIANDSGRFNIVSENEDAKLLVIGHIDTVQPSSSWTKDPFKAEVIDNKIYGLGAWDMKGPLASFITAFENIKEKIDISKLGVLLYIDEEYDFLGMKRYTQDTIKIKPELVMSLDGEDKLRSGCRGLIEIDIEVIGQSGHSSKPYNGNNAITQSVQLVNILTDRLMKITDENFGYTSVNLAYLRGGKISKLNDSIQWFREGNIIPDYADLTIEVRTVNEKTNAKYIIKLIQEISKILEVKINIKRIRHDITPWKCSYNDNSAKEIQSILSILNLNTEFENVTLSGYVDIGMLEKCLPTAPKYTYGISGANAHSADEYANIDSLESTVQVYEELILKYCNK